MALRANAVRPLGFRLPETSLQISGIISLREWDTAPLQGFLLQRITEKNVGIYPRPLWDMNPKFQFKRPKEVHASYREATGTENLLLVR
jgi:hypothetical protein